MYIGCTVHRDICTFVYFLNQKHVYCTEVYLRCFYSTDNVLTFEFYCVFVFVLNFLTLSSATACHRRAAGLTIS
jgi:hypothetical protein